MWYFRITNDSVKRGSLIGRGAFGFVYEAFVRQQRGSFSIGAQGSPSGPQSGGNGMGRSVDFMLRWTIFNDYKSTS